MQWQVMTTAGDKETCSACFWMCTGQFDINLAELKSMFNEIFKIMVLTLIQTHEYWCNAAMTNSNRVISTRKRLNCGVRFRFSLMKIEVSKSLWIIIETVSMLLIKKPYSSVHTTSTTLISGEAILFSNEELLSFVKF